jgi:hypothetical protein
MDRLAVTKNRKMSMKLVGECVSWKTQAGQTTNKTDKFLSTHEVAQSSCNGFFLSI